MGIFYKNKVWNMVLTIDKYFVLLAVLFGGGLISPAEKAYEKTTVIEIPIVSEETLVVKNTNGDIVVDSWEKDSIRIEIRKIVYANSKEEAEGLYEKIEIKFKRDSNSILLMPRFFIEHASVDFQIYLPEKMNLKLNTGNGMIKVRGIHGFMNLVSSNGRVFCSDVFGSIRTRTGNGDIILEMLSGIVSALSDNGKIKCDIESLDFNSVSRVETRNGDIEISAPIKSDFYIYAYSSNGGVESEIPIYTKKDEIMNKEGTKIFVISSNGNIKICKK